MRLALLFLLIAQSTRAAVICVGAASSGSGNGSDWNNMAQWSSVTLTRGNTYYLADGAYGGRTLSTALSGTSMINIVKACVGNTTVEAIAGWTSTLGDGQATFSGTVRCSTGYWLIDGYKGGGWTGGAPDKTAANYGFSFSSVAFPIEAHNSSANISNITFKRIVAIAPTADVEKRFFGTANDTDNVGFLTISYCYAYGFNGFTWGTAGGGIIHDGWVHEYNVFEDIYVTSTWHGELLHNNFGDIRNWHIRYNWMEGVRSGSTTPTMIIGALNDSAGPYFVYGNVFKDLTFTDGGICAVENGQGTHSLSGTVYNNTFDNCTSPFSNVQIVGGAGNNSMTVHNNIFANMEVDEGTSGAFTYNGFYNTDGTPGSNNQIFGGDPFDNAYYALTGHTTTGTTLSSPYDEDVFGHERGADGFWDRGAIQFFEEPPPGPTTSTIGGNLNIGGNLILGQ